MIRYHDVSQLATAELERAKRELQTQPCHDCPAFPRARADPGDHCGSTDQIA